jgi:hypothetical protein
MQAQEMESGGLQMIKRHYEIITSIECDCCLMDEFNPDLEEKDATEVDLAWEQAKNLGWYQIEENGEIFHYCPTCKDRLKISGEL